MKAQFFGTQDGDCAQVFGAHQRAESVATVEMTQVVGDVGKAHQIHSRQTGLGDSDLFAAIFITDRVFNLPGSQTGEMGRIFYLGLGVADP